MSLLSVYRTEVRRLLHDANGRVFSDSQLNDYINEGRNQVAVDTHCLRGLGTTTLTTGTETYLTSALTSVTTRCIDITNITVLWGSQRVPLDWYSFTEFNARFRTFQVNRSRPCAWAFTGMSAPAQLNYIQPVPDQSYSAEIDYYYIPVALVDDTTVDELSYPFTKPVAYYACAKAKESEQSYGEQEQYMKQYGMKGMEAINSFTRRLPSVYR